MRLVDQKNRALLSRNGSCKESAVIVRGSSRARARGRRFKNHWRAESKPARPGSVDQILPFRSPSVSIRIVRGPCGARAFEALSGRRERVDFSPDLVAARSIGTPIDGAFSCAGCAMNPNAEPRRDVAWEAAIWTAPTDHGRRCIPKLSNSRTRGRPYTSNRPRGGKSPLSIFWPKSLRGLLRGPRRPQ